MRLVLSVVALVSLAGCSTSAVPAGHSDPGARPSAELTSFWDGDGWATDSRVVWTYDRLGGEATVALTQSWQDGAWAAATKEEWTLNAAGRQSAGTASEWADGAWHERGRMAFFYDADGHKTAARRRVLGEDGGLVNADSLASTFDAAGREVERRFFRWADGAWAEVLRQRSTYDAGREAERVHLAPGADGWREQRRWTFSYGAGGLRTGSRVEQVEEGTWQPWLDQTYAHDASGRPTAVVHEEWDGEAWAPMMRNETRYDAAP